MPYLAEVDANFARFTSRWRRERDAAQSTLDGSSEVFKGSYRRLTSLQAWRSQLLEGRLDVESLAFFLEAQNDVLVSHTLAQSGAWRSALQALRSCLENVVACVYYKDHPIELRLWKAGRHRIGFAASVQYLKEHPEVSGLPRAVTGIDLLEREYATLSRAVHASAVSFRMTADAAAVQLWSPSTASLGKWNSRESDCITAVNLLLVSVFRSELQGARLPGLRQAVSLSISTSRHAAVKKALGVTLAKP